MKHIEQFEASTFAPLGLLTYLHLYSELIILDFGHV